MTASFETALARIEDSGASADGRITQRAPKPNITQYFVDVTGRIYQATFDVNDTDREYVEGLFGCIYQVNPWINKAGKPYISVYGMASRLEHWQLSMPCQNNQYHYRTMLPKLALVDLQDRPVKLITEKGNKAVFTQVFLDYDELEAVKANPIAAGPDALDKALNQVRAQLDQSPIDPEWRTPQTKEDYSQTPSQVIDCESSPVD